MIVQKFGGTSVADPEAIRRLITIVRATHERDLRGPVVVVSAMSGVTDALLTVAEAGRAGHTDEALSCLRQLRERHLAAVTALTNGGRRDDVSAFVTTHFDELHAVVRALGVLREVSGRTLDAIAACGELLNSRIVAAAIEEAGLPASWVDARRTIVTDDEHTRAAPLMRETAAALRASVMPLVDTGRIPVLGGFVGATTEGITTTLGRGGSDYSAAIFAAALNARELQIWTDVTGVLTCDPRVCPEARTLRTLSYEEAAELAYFGAKVLHPKTIQPAVDLEIPVRVCNSREPDERGTMVLPATKSTPRKIKSIAHKTGITVLHITSARMLGAYGFMSAIFQIFERHRTVVDVVTTSEVSVSLTLENTDSLEAVVADLERIGTVDIEPDQAIVCLVGSGLRQTAGVAAQIFAAIAGFNVSMISHGASGVNLTFVVKQDEVGDVIKSLHRTFFTEDNR